MQAKKQENVQKKEFTTVKWPLLLYWKKNALVIKDVLSWLMQLELMLVLLRFTNRLFESKNIGKGILKSHVQCFP